MGVKLPPSACIPAKDFIEGAVHNGDFIDWQCPICLQFFKMRVGHHGQYFYPYPNDSTLIVHYNDKVRLCCIPFKPTEEQITLYINALKGIEG